MSLSFLFFPLPEFSFTLNPFLVYTSLGCFNDNATFPALRNNEGKGYSFLDGPALARTDPINKCYQTASQLGHNVFGLQNGDCVSMSDVVPNGDYSRYGTASICPSDGLGASLISNVYQIAGATNYNTPDYSTLPYTSLGCWKDSTTNRAMTLLEGDSSLDGANYAGRLDAINKCSAAAIARNLTVFGIQDGGQCWGALDNIPAGDYARQGNSTFCPRDGKGAKLIHHVYQIKNAPQASTVPKPYVSLGCWNDVLFNGSKVNRALRINEGPTGYPFSTVGTLFTNILDGIPALRADAINKCYQVALQQGHNVFAVQSGMCSSQLDIVPGGSYAQFGNSSSCPADGRGGNMINHVYQILNAPQAVTDYTNLPYTSLGCWNDAYLTLRINEGPVGYRWTTVGTLFTNILDGSPLNRMDAINKCYQVALQQGHNVFALQNGGICASDLDVVPGGSYAQLGNTTYCPTSGRGGNMINHVYQIKNSPQAVTDYTNLPYTSLGCWNDANAISPYNRAVRINEGPVGYLYTIVGTLFTNILDGSPLNRTDAINKCYQVALQQGHNVFALQNGICSSQPDIVPGGSYAQFGNASFCARSGRGGHMINHVYQIKNAPQAVTDYTNLPYTSLGCWNDGSFLSSLWNRALRINEASTFSLSSVSKLFTNILDGSPLNRTDAINKCYQVALQQGHNIFALQNGGYCHSSLDIVPGGLYAQLGNASYCPRSGWGGFNVNHVYQIKNAPQAVTDYTNLPYTSLGCWNDPNSAGFQYSRSIRLNEGPAFSISTVGAVFTNILDGNPLLRSDAINKCYQVAQQQGHNIFALQNGGFCYSQLDNVPGGTYTTYGNNSYCSPGGKGGYNINHVYQIKSSVQASLDFANLPYTSLGCWTELSFRGGANRALRINESPSYHPFSPVLSTYTNILDGNPIFRTDAINKCYQVALLRGHNVFALHNGGLCSSQLDIAPGGSYAQFGSSSNCPADGKGTGTAYNTYQIKNMSSVFFDWAQLPYASLGCYFDLGSPRYIRSNEGSSSILDGPGFNRTDAINKCYQVALQQGHNIFALQFGGQCFSAFDIYPGGDYARYGVSTYCPTDGKGGSGINHVYRILSIPSKILTFADLPYRSGLPFYSLGCWADSSTTKALTIQEGTDPILDGSFNNRANAIYKCYQVAAKRGHNVFALQNNGQCYSKLDTVPGGAYAQYGPSNLCTSSGRGATNANNVYRLAA